MPRKNEENKKFKKVKRWKNYRYNDRNKWKK